MSYNYIEDDVNGNYKGDYVLEINVMGAKYVSSAELDRAYDGVRNAVQIVYNTGYVNGTIVRKYTTDNAVDCSNRYSDGRRWLNNNSLNGDGVYLWVTGCSGASGASIGAWEGREQAFVTTTINSNNKFKALAVQEGFHPYINKNCKYVDRKLGNTGNGEHDLGESAFINGRDYITPMATTYNDSISAGTCDNGNDKFYSYTTDVTLCTKQSIKSSWRHAQSNGNH